MDRSGSSIVEKHVDNDEEQNDSSLESSLETDSSSKSIILSSKDSAAPVLDVEVSNQLLKEAEKNTPLKNSDTQSSKAKAGPRIWAVGGGKGGVGKSLISANFSLKMAQRGRKVVAIDLDLGGSNLHTCLGVAPPKYGVGDWVQGRKSDLETIMSPTPYPGLAIISGSTDPLKIDLMLKDQIDELFTQLRALDADEVVVDLGAGSHQTTIDFFNHVDEGILSILPEPTSVENAYRFIKAAFFGRLKKADVPRGIAEVIEAGTDPNNILGIKTPSDLMMIVERMDPNAYEELHTIVKHFKPHIVINQVRTPVDIDVGRAICSVCRRYFGLDVQYSGYLDYDSTVWKAIRNRKPVLKEFPLSPLSGRIDRLTSVLLGEEKGMFR